MARKRTISPIEAERAAEWYLHRWVFCVITRRAIRTRFHKVDFFGADVMGKRRNGDTVYAQVTTGGPSAVRARKRKLMEIPWSSDDIVYMISIRGDKMRIEVLSKVLECERYVHKWKFCREILVPKEWLRPWRDCQ